MTTIFLNYREDDSLGQTSRLYDRLSAAFEAGTILCDKATLRLGKWADQVNAALDSAKVTIVVIGPRWESRRLWSKDDPVRAEIERSLRAKATLVPLLVDGAALPPREALPPSLHRLLDYQAVRLSAESHDGYNGDVKSLIARLRETLAEMKVRQPGAGHVTDV